VLVGVVGCQDASCPWTARSTPTRAANGHARAWQSKGAQVRIGGAASKVVRAGGTWRSEPGRGGTSHGAAGAEQ
jgi:hypothetical protein